MPAALQQEDSMAATYVILLNYTEQGIKNFKSMPDRVKAAEQAFAQAGGRMHSFHLTMGQYDAVVIAEFPDDAAAARAVISQAALGNARTTTLRAFTREEAESIARGLP
jgi:uncharacterized protein with GYD domain